MTFFVRWLMTITLTMVAPVLVHAHHVVWLDFSDFDLSDNWTTVNGNTPPTATDTTLVRQQIIANMARDYAPFDIYFSEDEPTDGRFTRVKILATVGVSGGTVTY